MVNYRANIERHRSHVQKHTRNINERSEKENPLAAEEGREEEPSEAVCEGPSWRVGGRGEPARLGPASSSTSVTVPR
jgi:hypothetical protein